MSAALSPTPGRPEPMTEDRIDELEQVYSNLTPLEGQELIAEVKRLQKQILIAREVAVAMSQNLRTADATMYSARLLANLDGRDTPYGRTYDSLHAKNEKLRDELETRSGQLLAEARRSESFRIDHDRLAKKLRQADRMETVAAELGRFKAAVATMREDHEGCVIGAFDGCQTCIALDALDQAKEGDQS